MVSNKITAKMPQTKKHFIKPLWIIIDKNPKTLTGTSPFSLLNGKAYLAMRIHNTSAAYVLDIITAGLCTFVEDLYTCCKLKHKQLIRTAWHRNE